MEIGLGRLHLPWVQTPHDFNYFLVIDMRLWVMLTIIYTSIQSLVVKFFQHCIVCPDVDEIIHLVQMSNKCLGQENFVHNLTNLRNTEGQVFHKILYKNYGT